MRPLRPLVFFLFVLSFAHAAPQTSLSAVLPDVTAYALDRQKVTLPANFATPLNVLVLYFQRDQQQAVDNWFATVATPDTSRVQTWLLPISPRQNPLYKWWQNASLRGTQATAEPRHYTVPLYVDEAQFLRALQITSQQEVVLLVTDQQGKVLWRTSGPVDDGKKAALTAFLKMAKK